MAFVLEMPLLSHPLHLYNVLQLQIQITNINLTNLHVTHLIMAMANLPVSMAGVHCWPPASISSFAPQPIFSLSTQQVVLVYSITQLKWIYIMYIDEFSNSWKKGMNLLLLLHIFIVWIFQRPTAASYLCAWCCISRCICPCPHTWFTLMYYIYAAKVYQVQVQSSDYAIHLELELEAIESWILNFNSDFLALANFFIPIV